MLKFEQRWIDPTPAEVRAGLDAAAAAANKGCRVRRLESDPAKWAKFGRRCEKEPEGVESFRAGRGGIPATVVLGAWWTDFMLRKHVVIRGRRVSDDDERMFAYPSTYQQHPPLWTCYPDRMVLQRDRRGSRWIVVCGCGAAGEPAALGWTGELCGPCFDRQQEFGPDALAMALPGMIPPRRGPILALAANATGDRIATLTRRRILTVWHRADNRITSGAIVEDDETDREPNLLCSFGNTWFTGQAGTDLGIDLTWAPFNFPVNTPLHGLTRGPEDESVAIAHPNGVDILDFAARTIRRSIPFRNEFASRPWPSVGHRHVAILGGSSTTIYDTTTGRRTATIHFSDRVRRSLQGFTTHRPLYDSSTAQFYIGAHQILERFDPGNDEPAVQTSFTDPQFEPFGVRAAQISSLALTTDRRHLVVGSFGGLLLLVDAVTLAPAASFLWHDGSIQHLLVAGDLVATAGSDGAVKLWPLDKLLPSDD